MHNNKQYQLKIADYIISVSTLDDKLNLIVPNYLYQFVFPDNEIANVFINIASFIPESFNNNNVLFYADKGKDIDYNNTSPYNWCICESNTIRFIKIYKEENINKAEIIACFDKDACHWTIYYEKSNQCDAGFQIDPFMYPLGPLIIYYIANFHEGLMIHSSGIYDNNNGYIFSAASGVGKTTISNIWKDEKAQILNDDRLIIRKKTDKYNIYNSPMNYSDDSKMATLNYIFLIRQSNINYAKKINGTEAVARLMSNCIQHNYDEHLIINLLKLCNDICLSIPVYELGFVPDKSIVQFIRNYEFI